MKGNFKRLVALFLSLMMVIGAVGMVTFADETENEEEPKQTVWRGDDVAIEITQGKNGYTFMSVYRKPGHAYEMSNHMVSVNGGVNNDIPQTLIMVPAGTNYTWTPNGRYSFGASNYEILYCCDAVTGYEDGIYYKRMNLEDSDYYDEESAAHIRAIVTNSYPYVSLEEMKKNLAEEGFEGAEELTRAEVITAVQAAIWAYANVDAGEYYYSQTFDVPTNTQWGTVMHDYTNEMNVWWKTGYRKFSKDETVAARINSLIDYLKGIDQVYADKKQIVITNLEIVDFAPVMAKDGVYTVSLNVVLNNGGSSESDNVALDVYVGDTLVKTQKVEMDKTTYSVCVEAKAGDTVKAIVSGKQILPKGVYFYEPEGGRDVSQCTVGVAAGETDVYAEATVKPELPDIDPVTGTLNLKKVNYKGEALTGAGFELYIITEEGKLSAGEYFVDENGKLTVENLVPGSYELVETVVPTGYVDPEAAVKFVIDEEGNLTVEESEVVSLEDGVVVVENKLIPTEITLSGIKYLDEEVAPGFSFTLSYAGQYISTVLSGDDGIFNFGSFSFDEEGTYVYTIKEVIDAEDEEILYDESEYTVTVVVTLEGSELKATVSVEKDGDAHEGDIRFDNYTTPEIPDNPPPLNPPKTGDSSVLFALIGLITLIGAAFTFKKRREF